MIIWVKEFFFLKRYTLRIYFWKWNTFNNIFTPISTVILEKKIKLLIWINISQINKNITNTQGEKLVLVYIWTRKHLPLLFFFFLFLISLPTFLLLLILFHFTVSWLDFKPDNLFCLAWYKALEMLKFLLTLG